MITDINFDSLSEQWSDGIKIPFFLRYKTGCVRKYPHLWTQGNYDNELIDATVLFFPFLLIDILYGKQHEHTRFPYFIGSPLYFYLLDENNYLSKWIQI